MFDSFTDGQEVLQRSLSSLMAMTPSMSSHIISILTKRCCDALLPVRSIPSQFRATSNKRMPTEPSHFVSSILRAVKVFFGIGTSNGAGTSLKDDFLPSASAEVFENVCQRLVILMLICLALNWSQICPLCNCNEENRRVAATTKTRKETDIFSFWKLYCWCR